jgi:hypothetical protein
VTANRVPKRGSGKLAESAMTFRLFLQARDLAVDLLHQQVKSRQLIATDFAGAEIAQAVAHEAERHPYDVQRLPSLLQVAVELDLGRRDQVEVIRKPYHLTLDISSNLG